MLILKLTGTAKEVFRLLQILTDKNPNKLMQEVRNV